MYMMRDILYTCSLLVLLLCTGCSHSIDMLTTAYIHDPRCQPRQYCPYTDPPSPIRTEVLRSGSSSKDPAVR